MQESVLIVNDVTGLNPVPVWAIAKPKSVQEVVDAVTRTQGPLSVGGGHFSMGGQTASPGSLHLDMREFNQVVSFSPGDKVIRFRGSGQVLEAATSEVGVNLTRRSDIPGRENAGAQGGEVIGTL